MQYDEHYTSQTCPVCGERNKCQRIYRCRQCGATAPRDVIGATNILCIARHAQLVSGRSVPNAIRWLQPAKYPGPRGRPRPGSSGGHLACSSANNREAQRL
jgi:transposase